MNDMARFMHPACLALVEAGKETDVRPLGNDIRHSYQCSECFELGLMNPRQYPAAPSALAWSSTLGRFLLGTASHRKAFK